MGKNSNIERLKEKYEQLKKSSTLEEYTSSFRDYFGVLNDDDVNTKVLETLYYNFIEQTFNQTKREKFLVSEAENIYNKIEGKVDKNIKEDLEIYDFLQDEIAGNYGLQSFICGFTLANELNKSTKDCINNDKNLKGIIQKYKNIKGGMKDE